MEDGMFEAITAWATIVIAVGTLASIFFTYRGMQSQARSFAGSVSADLALKLLRDFEGDSNLELRSRVSDALLKGMRLGEAEDLFDFFEQVGFLVRRGLLDHEIAYSFFFHWTNLYWVAGKQIIQQKREGAASLWTDFEYLYDKLLQMEIKIDPKSRFINPSPELIKSGLEEELQ
jgi:hypothetical protein